MEAFGILKFSDSPRRTAFAAGGGRGGGVEGVADETVEDAAGATVPAAARATRFAARLLFSFRYVFAIEHRATSDGGILMRR